MFKSQIGVIMKKQKKSKVFVSKITGLSERTIIRLAKPVDLEHISLNTIIKIAFALECNFKDLFKKE